MAKYRLYAGLGGGFGGAHYEGTYEFEHEEDAMQTAHQLAVEEYQSYEGLHGLLDWGDCEEDCHENGFITDDMDEDEAGCVVDEMYNEEIESWIDYDIKLETDELNSGIPEDD